MGFREWGLGNSVGGFGSGIQGMGLRVWGLPGPLASNHALNEAQVGLVQPFGIHRRCCLRLGHVSAQGIPRVTVRGAESLRWDLRNRL